MDVTCSKCRSEYELDGARVPPPGLRVKCVECGHVFLVARPVADEAPALGVAAVLQPGAPAPALASPSGLRRAPVSGGSGAGVEAAASPPSAPRRDWKLRVGPGKVFSFRELTSLQKWIIEGKVSRDAEISLSGETWKPLGGIPELASFFQVFEAASRARGLEISRGSSPSGVLSVFASAPSPTPMDPASASPAGGGLAPGTRGLEGPSLPSAALPRVSESAVRRRVDELPAEASRTELNPVGLGVGLALAGGGAPAPTAGAGPVAGAQGAKASGDAARRAAAARAPGAPARPPAPSAPEFVSSAEVISSPELVPSGDDVLLSAPEDLVSVPGEPLAPPPPRAPQSQTFPERSASDAVAGRASAAAAAAAVPAAAAQADASVSEGSAALGAVPPLRSPGLLAEVPAVPGASSPMPDLRAGPPAWSARGAAGAAPPPHGEQGHSWSAHPLEATEEALTAAVQTAPRPWWGRLFILGGFGLAAGLGIGAGAYYWAVVKPEGDIRASRERAEAQERERSERLAAAQRAAASLSDAGEGTSRVPEAPGVTGPGVGEAPSAGGTPHADEGADGGGAASGPPVVVPGAPGAPGAEPDRATPDRISEGTMPSTTSPQTPAAPGSGAGLVPPGLPRAAEGTPSEEPGGRPADAPPSGAGGARAGPRPAAPVGDRAAPAGLAPPKVEVAGGGTGAPGPQIFDWYLKQGDRLRSLDKADKALGMYERALELDASSAEAFTGRGFALLDLGRGEEALQSFERALSLDPRYGPALIGTAEIYRAQKRPSDALLFYERYLRAQPRGPEASLAQRRIGELQAQLQEAQ